MKSIWKYGIPIEDLIEIEMPRGAQILAVDTQHGKPQLWALVDPQAPMVTRVFNLFGTGFSVADDPGLVYIGTFQVVGGDLVFHLFEGNR